MESLHFSENIELSSLSKDWLLYSDRNTYHKYQNDEFEFQDKIEQAGKKLQNWWMTENLKKPLLFSQFL